MSGQKSTAQLIFQGATHRLVSRGKFSFGYEDIYVLEKLETDALGAERWNTVTEWEKKSNYSSGDQWATALVELVKQALASKNSPVVKTGLSGDIVIVRDANERNTP